MTRRGRTKDDPVYRLDRGVSRRFEVGQKQSLQGLPDEETIRSVVYRFYSKIQTDDLLAPVFRPRLAGHWDEHLETMVDFWSSILLSSGRYRGRPLAVHGELGDITPEMWSRWLKLFGETVREQTTEPIAELFMQRAGQIASHLSKSLATKRLNIVP